MKKTAVITGGSSGLGFGMAKYLAAKEYNSVIIARQREKIDVAVDAIKKLGNDAVGFEGDITVSGDLKSISQKIAEQFGKVDFLILNAGVAHTKLLSDYDDMEEMKQDIEVNLWGTILSAYSFLNLLVPDSKILIVSSGFGLLGAAGYSIYCAAKAGLINFAEALKRELLYKKISVYVACPADIDTPSYRIEHANMPEWMKDQSPARKTVLSPETAAAKILKKCSGKRFIITSDSGLYFFLIFKKFFPYRMVDYYINKLFPVPRI